MSFLQAVMAQLAIGYPNGMFPTPPLGWSGYQALMQGSGHCSDAGAGGYTDGTFRASMNILESTGLLKLGYNLVLADDCWIADNRSATGEIVADPTRFPHGMKPLTDFAHEKGMLFGLYAAAGAETCRKYPGSLGHEALDAATYAKYGADMVKLDACGRSPLGGPDWSVQYDTWSAALRSQNKTISFSCEWPAYYDICVMETKTPSKRHPNRNISYCGLNTPWAPGPSNTHVADICQSWRYSADSFDVWNSTVQILEAATTGAPYLDTPFHKLVDTGPGAWNDADFVSAGCPTDRECGLGEKVTTPMTALEQRTQMSMWAMIASPIIIGSDIRNLTDGSAHSRYTLETLANIGVLNISQDVGGIQGWRLKGALAGPQAWVRPLAGIPALGGHRADAPQSVAARKALASCCRHSVEQALHVAVALFNGGESTTSIALGWSEIGWKNGDLVSVAWPETSVAHSATGIRAEVLPHQAVVMTVKAT